MKRSLALALLLVVLFGCKDLTFGGASPRVTGVWVGVLDAQTSMTLLLSQPYENADVDGSGLITFADSALALEVTSGIYVHPSVSLVLESDIGRFSLVGNRSQYDEPLRYGVDVVTISGELNGTGFNSQAVVLIRQDSISHASP